MNTQTPAAVHVDRYVAMRFLPMLFSHDYVRAEYNVFLCALSVDGVQERLYGSTGSSALDGLETLMGFDLYEWWQPRPENYFGRLTKPLICAALTGEGLTGKASDAAKMKKGDAAALAAAELAERRWLPSWLTPVAVTDAQNTVPDDLSDVA